MRSRIPLFIDVVELKGFTATIYATMHFLRDLAVCCPELVCYCPALREDGLRQVLHLLRESKIAVHLEQLSRIKVVVRVVVQSGFAYSGLAISASDFIQSFEGSAV